MQIPAIKNVTLIESAGSDIIRVQIEFDPDETIEVRSPTVVAVAQAGVGHSASRLT
jgi:hypothetical protein